MIKGLLYYQQPDSEPKLVISTIDKFMILKRYHDSYIAGHPGINKTYQKIKEKYYWRGMSTDIKKYVTTCDVFQKKKRSKRNKAPLQAIKAKRPFRKLGLDTMGPIRRKVQKTGRKN